MTQFITLIVGVLPFAGSEGEKLIPRFHFNVGELSGEFAFHGIFIDCHLSPSRLKILQTRSANKKNFNKRFVNFVVGSDIFNCNVREF